MDISFTFGTVKKDGVKVSEKYYLETKSSVLADNLYLCNNPRVAVKVCVDVQNHTCI